MKTLLISLICTCASVSLFAQADTTNTMNSGTYNNSNNPANTDTSGTMGTMNGTSPNTDSSGNMNNNMNNNLNSNMDTSSNINNSSAVPPTANADTDSTNNSAMNSGYNQNASMQNSTAVTTQNASLPVLETYVPQNIVDQAKQKYPSGQIYDITAVRSPEDTMTQKASGMNAWNSSTKNSAMDQDHDRDDSSMNQNSAMNSTSQNQNSTISSGSTTPNSATANNDNSNTTDMMANATVPEKFDYVVRLLQGGQMQTEKLKSDGTALVVRTTSPDASLTNQ